MISTMAFAVTVDLVVFTIREDELSVLTVRRGVPPYRGRWALPGGFVQEEEEKWGFYFAGAADWSRSRFWQRSP